MKTLVIGASTSPERYSFKAANMLHRFGHEIELFGKTEGEIHGVAIKHSFQDFNNIDTVTMYVSPKHQHDLYEKIINLKPRRVIFNPGTENSEFENLLEKNNIETIEACTLVMLSTGQYS